MSLGKKKIQHQAAASGVVNTENFAPVLYTGNGSSQSISSLDFQPDFIWFKNRDDTDYNTLYDSIRGAGKFLSSNTTAAEVGNSGDLLSSFDSNGFTVNNTLLGGSNTSTNGNNEDFVAWCWKAGGTAVSNTDGSITSSVSANTEAGFSIVKYTSTAAGSHSVGHGLGVTPEMVIVKRTDTTGPWYVFYDVVDGSWDYMTLNATTAKSDFDTFNSTNDTTFYSGPSGSGETYINYCFHSVDGYQKVGSYTGNTTTKPSVNTGFRPRFLMIKDTDSTSAWTMLDSARNPSNPVDARLKANESSSENTLYDVVDFTDTGFDILTNDNEWNDNGNTFIYLAIA